MSNYFSASTDWNALNEGEGGAELRDLCHAWVRLADSLRNSHPEIYGHTVAMAAIEFMTRIAMPGKPAAAMLAGIAGAMKEMGYPDWEFEVPHSDEDVPPDMMEALENIAQELISDLQRPDPPTHKRYN